MLSLIHILHGGRIIRSILSRGRDRAYVQELYAQHGLMMLRKAMSILPDEHDALDALNNACLSLLDKAETLRALPEKSLKRYLVITAEHAAIDILKKKNRENQYVFRAGDPLLEEIPSGEETADEVIIRAAEKEVLAGACLLYTSSPVPRRWPPRPRATPSPRSPRALPLATPWTRSSTA